MIANCYGNGLMILYVQAFICCSWLCSNQLMELIVIMVLCSWVL